MHIIAFSDLHLYFINTDFIVDTYKMFLKNRIKDKKIDMVLISGDIFESEFIRTCQTSKYGNPCKALRSLFELDESIPIVCCLGNHEFAYEDVNLVLSQYKKYTGQANVHYLDACGSYTKDNVNVVGNVFWYDNTLKSTQLVKDDVIVSNWLDSSIEDFIPSVECEKCKNQILENIKPDKDNILLTHCVPHKDLNWFTIYEPESVYNQYSGSAKFLENETLQKYVKWSICGHTHKYITTTIGNINCVNIGNDYFSEYHNKRDIKYFEFDI